MLKQFNFYSWLMTLFLSLSACSEKPQPFSPIFSESTSFSSDISSLIDPHIDQDQGFESSTSTSSSEIALGKVAHLEMTTFFQLEQRKATDLYTALLQGVKNYIKQAGCEVSGSNRITDGTGKVSGFNYVYSKGNTKGIIYVWGMRGAEQDFTLLITIMEN